MPRVAGVDSSTQSVKVVIRDADSGAWVRKARATHRDGTSVDPAAWVSALDSALEGLLDNIGAALALDSPSVTGVRRTVETR
jgi:xylulokinase